MSNDTLLIMPVPLLHAMFYLCHIVGSQGQALEMTTSSHRTRGDKVDKGETIKGPQRTPWTLHSLVDGLSCWVGPPWIIMGGTGILDIVRGLEPLEALHLGVVDILGKGDKSRRRRSVGSRHFNVEDGLMV